MRSAISPVEVRQAFTVVPAIICINLGFRVSYNNAYPAQVFQTDDLFGNQLNGAFFTLPIIILVPITETIACCRGREATRTEIHTADIVFFTFVNVVAAVTEYKCCAMSVSDIRD